MVLYIDSTDNTHTTIKIDDAEFVSDVCSPRKQDVFGLIVNSLENLNLKPVDITRIEVNAGPGSFTGTRIGVSIANALAFSLNIPVNGGFVPVEPVYSSPPSITAPK